MESKVIKNIVEDYGYVGSFYLPLFNKDISVRFAKDVDLDYVERCVYYLQSLDEKLINDFCESSISYYEDYVRDNSLFDEALDMPYHITGKDILKYMDADTLIVVKPKYDSIIAFNLSGSCLWEGEHGFSWVVNNGKTLYLGWTSHYNGWMEENVLKSKLGNFAITFYRRPNLIVPSELEDRKRDYFNNKSNEDNELETKKYISSDDIDNKKVNNRKSSAVIVSLIILLLVVPAFFEMELSLIKKYNISKKPNTSVNYIDKKCDNVYQVDDDGYGEYVELCDVTLEYEVDGKKYKTEKFEQIPLPDRVYYEKDDPNKYYILDIEPTMTYFLVFGAIYLFFIIFSLVAFVLIVKNFIKEKNKK